MESIAMEAKRRLLERRRALVGLRRQVDDSENELLETRETDWPDVSATQQTAGVLDELSERELQELAEIDAALQRLRDDAYGKCQSCGAAIGRLRLRAIPEARKCLACESQREVGSSVVQGDDSGTGVKP